MASKKKSSKSPREKLLEELKKLGVELVEPDKLSQKELESLLVKAKKAKKAVKGIVVIDINGKDIVKSNLEKAKSYIKRHGGRLK